MGYIGIVGYTVGFTFEGFGLQSVPCAPSPVGSVFVLASVPTVDGFLV